MPSWLPTIIVALIALIGTIFGAYLAHRQWKITRRDSKKQAFTAKRREIYEQLGNMASQFEIDLRIKPDAFEFVNLKITEVNTFVLKNQVYLADDDHVLVDNYLKAQTEAAKWCVENPDPQIRQNWSLTGEFTAQIIEDLGFTYGAH